MYTVFDVGLKFEQNAPDRLVSNSMRYSQSGVRFGESFVVGSTRQHVEKRDATLFPLPIFFFILGSVFQTDFK